MICPATSYGASDVMPDALSGTELALIRLPGWVFGDRVIEL